MNTGSEHKMFIGPKSLFQCSGEFLQAQIYCYNFLPLGHIIQVNGNVSFPSILSQNLALI